MSEIRPTLPPVAPSAPGGQREAVRNAQAAFFRAALGEAAPARPAMAVQLAAQAAVAPTPTRVAPAPASPTERSTRPGALLDIRV